MSSQDYFNVLHEMELKNMKIDILSIFNNIIKNEIDIKIKFGQRKLHFLGLNKEDDQEDGVYNAEKRIETYWKCDGAYFICKYSENYKCFYTNNGLDHTELEGKGEMIIEDLPNTGDEDLSDEYLDETIKYFIKIITYYYFAGGYEGEFEYWPEDDDLIDLLEKKTTEFKNKIKEEGINLF